MKAFVFTQYGPPSVLQLQEVEKPEPKENEVLVKIRATAINDYDWSIVRGKPLPYRLMFGLFKPKPTMQIPGMELSGTVEALGTGVTSFQVGDEVYGDTSEHGFGTFAEYIAIHEKAMTKKPSSMSFEEAASLSHASMLAYQGLIDVGKLEKGQQVLINGAGGGVGTFGLQIAKQFNAEVTGVDTGEKLKMMEALGFDHLIDFKQEDFTKTGKQYDLILDTKTTRPPRAHARALKPNGSYVTVGGRLGRLFQMLLATKFGRKNMHIVALKPNKDLEYMNQFYEKGKLKFVVDGPYPFEELPNRVQYFGEGKHSGKVIVTVV